jgi:Carbohydrate family 9 binding domain-like
MVTLYNDSRADPPGEYVVRRLPDAVSSTLAPDSAAWHDAATIAWGPQPYETRFRACWDADALHIRFDAADTAPWHTMKTRDEHLWEEEVVEIFIDVDGSGVNYAEVEISPANVVCDLRVELPWPSLHSLTQWDWMGMASTVVPLKEASGTEGWTAIARLPWSGLATLSSAAKSRVPPRSGDVWRFNVFRIKRPGGPGAPDKGAIFAAWSVPNGPSFHVPAKFQPFRFG